MIPWQRTSDTTVTKAGFRTITHKHFKTNSGKIMQADIKGGEIASASAVIALTSENKVIIARQFRCGPERIMDELPGGAVDEGETPLQAAKREMAEEVGYESDHIEYLGHGYTDGWSSVDEHYFIAYNCRRLASNNPEEFEEIEVDEISITELISNAREARMTDSLAVFLAYDRLIELEGKNTI